MKYHLRHEAAEKLRVSESTVDRLIKNGQLRAAKIGNRVLISDEAIEDLVRCRMNQDPDAAA